MVMGWTMDWTWIMGNGYESSGQQNLTNWQTMHLIQIWIKCGTEMGIKAKAKNNFYKLWNYAMGDSKALKIAYMGRLLTHCLVLYSVFHILHWYKFELNC